MARKRRRRGWHDVDKSDIPVSELLQSFLMDQEDRNHSPKTMRWYSHMLGRFVATLPAEALLREIDAPAIRPTCTATGRTARASSRCTPTRER